MSTRSILIITIQKERLHSDRNLSAYQFKLDMIPECFSDGIYESDCGLGTLWWSILPKDEALWCHFRSRFGAWGLCRNLSVMCRSYRYCTPIIRLPWPILYEFWLPQHCIEMKRSFVPIVQDRISSRESTSTAVRASCWGESMCARVVTWWRLMIILCS